MFASIVCCEHQQTLLDLGKPWEILADLTRPQQTSAILGGPRLTLTWTRFPRDTNVGLLIVVAVITLTDLGSPCRTLAVLGRPQRT